MADVSWVGAQSLHEGRQNEPPARPKPDAIVKSALCNQESVEVQSPMAGRVKSEVRAPRSRLRHQSVVLYYFPTTRRVYVHGCEHEMRETASRAIT